MGEFSITHIMLLLIVLLFVFGPKRLPQMGQSLGDAIRGFKNALNGGNNSGSDETAQRPQQSQQYPQQPQFQSDYRQNQAVPGQVVHPDIDPIVVHANGTDDKRKGEPS